MRKYLLFIYCILFFSGHIGAQNFDIVGEEYLSPFPGPYGIKIISGETLKVCWYSNSSASDWDVEKEFTYTIRSDSGLPYIFLDDYIPNNIELGIYTDSKPRDFGNKFLFLAGQVPVEETNFISKEQYLPKVTVGYTLSEDDFGSHIFLLDIPNLEGTSRVYKDPSSFLTEFGIEYNVENLNSFESDTPWVEAADGNGIGESFVISNSWNDVYPYLFIINGFISADRPRLYLQNGRIKRVKVEGVDSGDFGFCDVLDTPHPQTVDISFIKNAEDIKITIVDVYPGSKYEDTAIHYMITYDKKIIPYKNSIE